MVLRLKSVLLPLASLVCLTVSGVAQPLPSTISRIENGLTSTNQTITSRMAAHQITGLSLVLVESNTVRWQRSYGRRIAADPNSAITSTTRFDAASLSKPIAAAAAHRLVDERRVSMFDATILNALPFAYLTPAQASTFLGQFANREEIDLNRLLMHCAGVLFAHQVSSLGNTGVQSFALTSALPTMGQQMRGLSPAASNTRPVQTTAIRPKSRAVYSGAGYLLVEAIIDRHSPGGFSAYTTQMFRDLGMTSTTYADYPLLSTVSAIRQHSRHARGHLKGSTQSGRNYANHAAASLVTTTGDLARFLIMLNQNGISDGQRILTQVSVLRLTGRSNSSNSNGCNDNRIDGRGNRMGAGMRYDASGTFTHHRGTHNGYRAYMIASPSNQWAMAVLMTGDPNDATRFATELFRAVESAYGFTSGVLTP